MLDKLAMRGRQSLDCGSLLPLFSPQPAAGLSRKGFIRLRRCFMEAGCHGPKPVGPRFLHPIAQHHTRGHQGQPGDEEQ